MLPVCSAATYTPLFNQVISHEGSRMLYPLRKANQERCFIDERQGFYARDGSHVQDMSFKTKATQFTYSLVVEALDLSTSQDPSTFPPYLNDFDDIVLGFPNEYVEEHEKWSCLASDINNSCHSFDDLKYVDDSDVLLASYEQIHGLESESVNGISHARTSLEALASQYLDPSTVANSKVEEVAKIPDFLGQNLIGLSTFVSAETFSASDATTGTLPVSPLAIPDIQEVFSKKSSDLTENVGNFLTGIENSVEKLLDRTNDSITTTLNEWNLFLSDVTKAFTETYNSAISSLLSSIDNSKGQVSNQLSGFSITVEKNISMAGAIVIDIIRWTITGVESAISNGATFVVYNYSFSKTFLPLDLRNALNMFEDEITRSLSPIGLTFHQVYEAIEEIERNLGLDPNDPLVPFILLVGTTTTIGISYWLFKYDGYSLSPERTSELLKNDKNALLIDVRPEVIRERDGIPDLRREARSKYASVDPLEIDNLVRKQLKRGNEIDNALIAVVIRNLKNVKKGTQIIIMDSDTGRSKAIARSVKKLGLKEPYLVEGGFQNWTRKGLHYKKPKPETALTILNEELEAIFEDIKPSPVQFIGYGLGALAAFYALLEWEKTLQIIGIVGIGQTLYRRVASYKGSDDLKQDVRMLLAPVTFGGNAISWVTGKLESKMIRLPTTPSSSAVQDRVLQAAAKHASQPPDAAEGDQGQAGEPSGQANGKLDLSEDTVAL